MSLEIKVGPPQLAIHQGNAVLITEPDGQVLWPTAMGLYFFDTRMISAWSLSANGVDWDLLNSGTPTYYLSRIYLTNRAIATESGNVAPRTLSLVVSRQIEGGIHEDFDLTNHGSLPVRFNLEIVLRSDFADIFEVKDQSIVRRGRITSEWLDVEQRLVNTYGNQDFHRALSVSASGGPSPAVYANGRISFEVALQPGEKWHTCLRYDLQDGDTVYEASLECCDHADTSTPSRIMEEWRAGVTKLETGNSLFQRLYDQALDDMAALRLPFELATTKEFVPIAGLPWFIALFGRDSLIVSLQNAMVYPDFARGTLDILGKWQATERDDYRDAEPGKILHELRRGELAHFKLIPHTPYYGTADATPLYLITLHDAWRCTGDRAMVERQMPVAERCLQWIDEWGDRDGDGFQEYQTRSPKGYENMAWKDSGDSVMHADGSKVVGPKALCELQGYVFDAWIRMAEIFQALGHEDRAAQLQAKAAALHHRFNDAFWNEAEGFYAYGLDGAKRPILSVASNPGHLLWSGLVPPDRAARVVQRLMQPDMWSGWGIRTLSASHPSYNPYSYQNGSVWPHDNGLIAQGFKRYGFAAEANAVAADVMGAASFFMLNQLPELYAGVQREPLSFPVQYLGANVPQAWAAGSVFSLVQAMVGFQPDAPNQRLRIDPTLPDWLPELTLRDLRVGADVFDIRFERNGAQTEYEVLRGDPARVVRQSHSVWTPS
ncbi:glycogen debranching N-terminal domain-containing protein [Acidisphaera sp. L21]|uniref:amylo-alpha-1,6-glucosidase n=1 Tax=Acidisphaera sp. L21 TaxID=1641851 RepID=UPI00131E5580|nr:glycogen debranching N-terminal domain-containing protein [Acidisphaera sp. L21]